MKGFGFPWGAHWLTHPQSERENRKRRHHRVSVNWGTSLSPVDGQNWHLDLLLESPADPRAIPPSCWIPLLKQRPTGYPQSLWGKSKSRNVSLHRMWPSHDTKFQWTPRQQYQWLSRLLPQPHLPTWESSELWGRRWEEDAHSSPPFAEPARPPTHHPSLPVLGLLRTVTWTI